MKFSEMYPAVGLRANRKEKRKKVPRLSMKKDYHRLQKKGNKLAPINFRRRHSIEKKDSHKMAPLITEIEYSRLQRHGWSFFKHAFRKKRFDKQAKEI